MKNILNVENFKWIKGGISSLVAFKLDPLIALILAITFIAYIYINWHFTYKMRDYIKEVDGNKKILK